MVLSPWCRLGHWDSCCHLGAQLGLPARGLGSLSGGPLRVAAWIASWHGGWVPRRDILLTLQEDTPQLQAYQVSACSVLTADPLARASLMAKLLVHVGGLPKGQTPGFVVHEGATKV